MRNWGDDHEPHDPVLAKDWRHALECLHFAASVQGVALQPTALRAALAGGTLKFLDLARLARQWGMRGRISPFGHDEDRHIRLPALLQLQDRRYQLLVRLDRAQAVIFDPLAPDRPRFVSREELTAEASEQVIELDAHCENDRDRKGTVFAVLLQTLGARRSIVLEILAASLAIQFFALSMPLFSQMIIDKVLNHRNLAALHVLGIGMIFLIGFEVAFSFFRSVLLAHTATQLDAWLGAYVVRHMLHLPLRFFEARKIGDLSGKLREIETIRHFLTGSSPSGLVDLFFTVVFLAVMSSYSVVLTLLVMAAVPLLLGISMAIQPLIRRAAARRYQQSSHANTLLLEMISGIHSIKALAIESTFQERWQEALSAQVASVYQAARLNAVSQAFNHLLQRTVTLTVLWAGAYLSIDGNLTAGQVIAFQMLALRVIHPMTHLVQVWQEFQQMRFCAEELGDILDTRLESGAGAEDLRRPINGKVVLENVMFRYSAQHSPVLDGLSLRAVPGQVIGIVGYTGGGKSTLAKLLHRLYLPERGRILIDDIDVARYDPSHLRAQIGVVPQDIFLFSGTIAENIGLCDPGAARASIIAAAELADAHAFINSLPQGYDTPIGERGGVQLSGGQRQKIAIARALHARPRILILDEATSALDYESERKVQERLRAACANCTVFVIAHRLSTVSQADSILVLNKGRFVEAGRHEELLQRGGLYCQLYLQGEQRDPGDGHAQTS